MGFMWLLLGICLHGVKSCLQWLFSLITVLSRLAPEPTRYLVLLPPQAETASEEQTDQGQIQQTNPPVFPQVVIPALTDVT